MALELETIEINGAETEVYRVDGHPIEDLLILKQDLSPVDEARLLEAATGDLKDRELDEIEVLGEEEPVKVTGTYLNLLQAKFKDINKWASDYFTKLLFSEEVITEVLEKANIATHQVDVIYGLTKGGGESGGSDLGDKIAALEARVAQLEQAGE